jgi:hypothetical protein
MPTTTLTSSLPTIFHEVIEVMFSSQPVILGKRRMVLLVIDFFSLEFQGLSTSDANSLLLKAADQSEQWNTIVSGIVLNVCKSPWLSCIGNHACG